LNYSRLYQFTPATAASGASLESALPRTNGDDAHQTLFDSLKVVFHTYPRRQFGLFDAEFTASAFAVAVGDGQIRYLFLFKHDDVHHVSAQQIVTTGRTIQTARLQYAVKLSVGEWQSAKSKNVFQLFGAEK
jgi:hypothetical protein